MTATDHRRTAPFDAAAEAYDRTFTHRPVPRILRTVVRERMLEVFPPGGRVLELGCGTGEDAVMLARRGMLVTAVDASGKMLEVARRKANAAGVDHRLELHHLDLGTEPLPGGPGGEAYAAAFSSFGVLNCLADRRPLAAALARRMAPGAPLLLVVMGPLCPWEVLWYLARLRPRTALRRLRGGIEARVGDPPTPVRVWYPSARRLAGEFAPWFRRRSTVGLGVVLPPPYLGHLVEARPRVRERLAAWDRRLGPRLPGRWLNDHYLLHLERRGAP